MSAPPARNQKPRASLRFALGCGGAIGLSARSRWRLAIGEKEPFKACVTRVGCDAALKGSCLVSFGRIRVLVAVFT